MALEADGQLVAKVLAQRLLDLQRCALVGSADAVRDGHAGCGGLQAGKGVRLSGASGGGGGRPVRRRRRRVATAAARRPPRRAVRWASPGPAAAGRQRRPRPGAGPAPCFGSWRRREVVGDEASAWAGGRAASGGTAPVLGPVLWPGVSAGLLPCTSEPFTSQSRPKGGCMVKSHPPSQRLALASRSPARLSIASGRRNASRPARHPPAASAARGTRPPAAAAKDAASGALAALPTMEPRLLCSRFLSSEAAANGQQLAVVLLNWTLPELTPRLWHNGVQPTACRACCLSCHCSPGALPLTK